MSLNFYVDASGGTANTQRLLSGYILAIKWQFGSMRIAAGAYIQHLISPQTSLNIPQRTQLRLHIRPPAVTQS